MKKMTSQRGPNSRRPFQNHEEQILSLRIRIIRPSGREKDNLLPARIADLEALGHTVLFQDTSPSEAWRYAAASIQSRAAQLNAALVEKETDLVLCGRGGYGASDLLPLIDWKAVAKCSEKMIVGFSDISAIHSALYTKAGWQGIHGPMPATTLWGKNSGDDIAMLFQVIEGKQGQFTHALRPIAAGHGGHIHGRLFGGCFSVLTNLIGTPFLPRSLRDSILILEDVSEHPARLMRYWNQWIQSGLLVGVQAIILGTFLDMGDEIPDSAPGVLSEFALRSGLPTFHCSNIGHISPNLPFQIGVGAEIRDNNLLIWTTDKQASA
jgi:muramoyltetrapeptide carboxypeptidase